MKISEVLVLYRTWGPVRRAVDALGDPAEARDAIRFLTESGYLQRGSSGWKLTVVGHRFVNRTVPA